VGLRAHAGPLAQPVVHADQWGRVALRAGVALQGRVGLRVRRETPAHVARRETLGRPGHAAHRVGVVLRDRKEQLAHAGPRGLKVTLVRAVQPAHAGPKGLRETRGRPARVDPWDGVALKARAVRWGSRANLDRLGQPGRLAQLVRRGPKDQSGLLAHAGLEACRDTAVQPGRAGQLGLRATLDRAARWASALALWFT